MHVQVRINRKVKMKSTKTQCYVAEKKFRERYPKIQLRSSSQRSTQLPFESGTSRAISTVAILLCLSFLVSLVLQYWSVRSSKRKGLQETKQELLFHSNQDQFVRGCLRGWCLGTLKNLKSKQKTVYFISKNMGSWNDGTTESIVPHKLCSIYVYKIPAAQIHTSSCNDFSL